MMTQKYFPQIRRTQTLQILTCENSITGINKDKQYVVVHISRDQVCSVTRTDTIGRLAAKRRTVRRKCDTSLHIDKS
jgi:hypothetical protein